MTDTKVIEDVKISADTKVDENLKKLNDLTNDLQSISDKIAKLKTEIVMKCTRCKKEGNLSMMDQCKTCHKYICQYTDYNRTPCTHIHPDAEGVYTYEFHRRAGINFTGLNYDKYCIYCVPVHCGKCKNIFMYSQMKPFYETIKPYYRNDNILCTSCNDENMAKCNNCHIWIKNTNDNKCNACGDIVCDSPECSDNCGKIDHGRLCKHNKSTYDYQIKPCADNVHICQTCNQRLHHMSMSKYKNLIKYGLSSDGMMPCKSTTCIDVSESEED